LDLLTKSSSEKLSKFLCPDYDGITEKHPHFKTFVEYIFRKPTLSTAPFRDGVCSLFSHEDHTQEHLIMAFRVLDDAT